ncbi:MAG: preprotein translocase subunit SecE [Clostridia bacterium]|nr:preprotein translocase subunit SecE [Clostridia bacterium]
MAESAKTGKVSVFTKIGKFFKDFISEFKKLVWPTKEQLMKNTAVVMVSIVVIGLVLAGIDFGLSKGFGALKELVKFVWPYN